LVVAGRRFESSRSSRTSTNHRITSPKSERPLHPPEHHQRFAALMYIINIECSLTDFAHTPRPQSPQQHAGASVRESVLLLLLQQARKQQQQQQREWRGPTEAEPREPAPPPAAATATASNSAINTAAAAAAASALSAASGRAMPTATDAAVGQQQQHQHQSRRLAPAAPPPRQPAGRARPDLLQPPQGKATSERTSRSHLRPLEDTV